MFITDLGLRSRPYSGISPPDFYRIGGAVPVKCIEHRQLKPAEIRITPERPGEEFDIGLA
jgi:hypothetical protein